MFNGLCVGKWRLFVFRITRNTQTARSATTHTVTRQSTGTYSYCLRSKVNGLLVVKCDDSLGCGFVVINISKVQVASLHKHRNVPLQEDSPSGEAENFVGRRQPQVALRWQLTDRHAVYCCILGYIQRHCVVAKHPQFLWISKEQHILYSN